jgi:hypothetical protein
MATTEKASQIDRFRTTARALGCDEDKEKFESSLKKIASHKPVLKKKRLTRQNSDKATS